jgi:hypothetical protein
MIPWVSMIVAPDAALSAEQDAAAHRILLPTTRISPLLGR